MKRTAVLAVLAAAVAVVLAGCGGPATSPGGSASTASTADHNDADVTFVQGMIPHHSQAIEMATMAGERGSSEQVKQLAKRIEQAQGPEIAQMQGFLTTWGLPQAPTTGSTGGMDHGSMPSADPSMGGMGQMPGMMTQAQMTALGQASGVDFDRMFLQMMVDHHTGAVQMSQTELASGQNPQAKALAQAIIAAQEAEITEMKDLLGAA